MARVTFHGAAGCVTGSATHLAWGATRVLVDCGLYQGDETLEARNRAPFPFNPAELTAVVATHAHLDHTGLLPRLAAAGYDGPVYCTRASRALISLLLEDAGELQEEEARYARRKGYSRHAEPRPLYTAADARAAIRLLAPLPFDAEHDLAPGVRLRYRRAGHLLGAATVEIEFDHSFIALRLKRTITPVVAADDRDIVSALDESFDQVITSHARFSARGGEVLLNVKNFHALSSFVERIIDEASG